MKKIYVNNTKRAIVFGKTMLLPGSNVAEEIDEKSFPTITSLIADGDIEISNDPEKAVNSANTQQVVEEIANMAPEDKKVKAAANKRKTVLDDIDTQAKDALAKKAKEDEKSND